MHKRLAVGSGIFLLLVVLAARWLAEPNAKGIDVGATPLHAPTPVVVRHPSADLSSERLRRGAELPEPQRPDTDASRPPTPRASSAPSNEASGSSPTQTEQAPADFSPPPPLHINREGIRQAIRSNRDQFKECYDAWIRVKPDLEGRVDIQFDIEADDAGQGVVSNLVVVDGGLGHPLMEGCLLNAMGDIRFEAPPNGSTRVVYPLVFMTRETPDAATP